MPIPSTTAPGYRKFELRPVPGGTLTEASCRYISPYGEIRSEWKIEDGKFQYTCAVPVSCTAYLTLPNGEKHTLPSGEYSFTI